MLLYESILFYKWKRRQGQGQPHWESRQLCLPLQPQLRRLPDHSHPIHHLQRRSRGISHVRPDPQCPRHGGNRASSETLSLTGWTSRSCWLLHILSPSHLRIATYRFPKLLSWNLRVTEVLGDTEEGFTQCSLLPLISQNHNLQAWREEGPHLQEKGGPS